VRCNRLQYLKLLFKKRFVFRAFFWARKNDCYRIQRFLFHCQIYRTVLYDFNFIISRHRDVFCVCKAGEKEPYG